MELHCIRHGVTIHNQEGRFNGWLDEGITPEQADALKKFKFAYGEFDAIYCSPLKRCVETAMALGIPQWIEEPRLKERNLGVFEGKTLEECENLYAEDYRQFITLDADFVIPEGESRKENLARVFSWLDEVSHANRILAVTHGGPIDFFYRLASGLELHGGDMVYAGRNAHRSIFTYDHGKWSVIAYDTPLL